MRRVALAILVAGFVAAGCTPTNPSPTTLSTTSSTAPAQGLREVVLTSEVVNSLGGIDSAYYPEGATISVELGTPWCVSLASPSLGGSGVIAGTQVCPTGEKGYVRTPPTPLLQGEHNYYFSEPDEATGQPIQVPGGVFRIRW